MASAIVRRKPRALAAVISTLSLPSSSHCTAKLPYKTQRSSSGALSYYACRLHSSSSTTHASDIIISKKYNIDICQSFREICSRVELVDRDRNRTSHSSLNNNTMQRTSAADLTSEFCNIYLSLPDKHPPLSTGNNDDDKQKLIELLLNEKYCVNEESILSAIDNVHVHSILRNSDIHRIRELCTPQYESIFQYILGSAQKDLGVAFLVKLRRDVREFIKYYKYAKKHDGCEGDGQKMQQQSKGMNSQQMTKLQALERSIHAILTSLFRPGVLNLQRITYEETPAAIIEQIALREAVHPLQSLEDLRTRLGPGRRCFAFFHPALPNKPLVFVHVALLQNMPKSMDDLQFASKESEPNATCATFYSITNTEPGLAGVDLGNHLIKSVVQVLQSEFPTLRTFCTLSPIPKFRNYLEGKIVRCHESVRQQRDANKQQNQDNIHDIPLTLIDDDLFSEKDLQQLECIYSSTSSHLDLLETLKSPTWYKDMQVADQLKPLLMKLASYYLTIEKHHGRPLCPVAKFHIRNGAELYRLNYVST